MLTKITLGCFSGAVGSIVIIIFLASLLAPDRPDVPYGSMMPMPIFYVGILGAVFGAIVHLISRKRIAQAAATGLIGGGIVGKIMLSFWLDNNLPRFHYSNVIIYMPVVIISGLIAVLGIALVIRLVVSKGHSVQ